MTRRERLSSIFNQFDNSAKEFADSAGGLFCETNAEYKGGELPENLKCRRAKIYFNAFVIEFKYTAHASLGLMHSLLEIIIFPGKSDGTTGIPLPFVADYLDNDALPLVIPFILDADGMKQAFRRVGAALKEMLDDISEIALDSARKKDLLLFYYKDLEPVFKIKVETDDEYIYGCDFYDSETYYRFVTARFSSNAFIQLLKGNNDRAIKEFQKYKTTFGYERRALRLLKEDKIPSFSDISAVTENLAAFGKSGAPKANFKELFTLFVSWLVLSAGISLVYVSLFLAIYFLEKQGAVYLMGAIYNLPYCALGGFLTGIALSYFTRFWFYRRFFKKDYKRFEKLDHIANGAGNDKIMKALLTVIVICSLIACVLLPNQNIRFSENGFTDNLGLFKLSGKYYGYDEIERVYYLPDRVNGFGKTVDYSSYVMALKDGTEIDFYEYDEIENYETDLLAFLQKKGVTIEKGK